MSNTSENDIVIIYDEDLYSSQYDEEILIHNIERLSQYSIFITQEELSNNFIWNYLLNTKYNKIIEDENVNFMNVISKYPDFSIPRNS